MIRQISVYTENKKGALGALVRTLSEAGVDLRSFVTNENGEFGTVRMLVDDHRQACQALGSAGYLTKVTTVLAVEVSDTVGGLAGLLTHVEAANLNINYLYAAWDRTNGQPFIVLHAQDMAELESFLVSRGYRALGRQEGSRP